MKRNRHTDEQIVQILREADQNSVAESARKHSVTEQTIYRWRRLQDPRPNCDNKELRGLRDENNRLKKLLAERDLELDVLKEGNEKKW